MLGAPQEPAIQESDIEMDDHAVDVPDPVVDNSSGSDNGSPGRQ